MRKFFRDVEVVTKEPSNTNSGLLEAWRFVSTDRLKQEISDETEIHSYISKFVKKGGYMPSLAKASKARIDVMKKVLALRQNVCTN